MIACAPSVAYISEPFGLNRPLGTCGVPIRYWFTYISGDNEQDFHNGIKKTLEFRFDMTEQWHTLRTPRSIARAAKIYLDFIRYRFSNARALLKDPIAVFSAPWLAEKFDMDVVVMIRHPAAFASSLKLLNWTHPFSHFLKQPLLIEDHLYPFETEIKKFACEEQEILDQAALLWKLIYYMVLRYKEQYPNWIFVRHEDLSRDPINGFRTIFRELDLEFTQYAADRIKRHSLSADTTDVSQVSPGSISRDSLSNISHWKNRLTKAEIERLKSLVWEISQNFYSEQEW
jgi:hypothetical protein